MTDFSVVIYLQTIDTFEDTLKSLEIQDADPQVIIFDATGDAVHHLNSISQDMHHRCSIINAEGVSMADAFNQGLDIANGRFICFIDDDAAYDAGSFLTVKSAFHEYNSVKAVSLRPIYTSLQDGEQQYMISPQASGIYSITENPDNFQFNSKAFFFYTEDVKALRFSDGLGVECCNKFLIDYFLIHDCYTYIAEKSVKYQKATECDQSNFAEQMHKKWYSDNAEMFLLQYARKSGEISETKKTWLQMAVYYLLSIRFRNNYQSKNKFVLSKEEALAFFDIAGRILETIDDEIIMTRLKFRSYVLDRTIRLFLMRLKFRSLGMPYRLSEKDGFFCFDYGDGRLTKGINTKKEKVQIYTMHYESGCLEIDFRISADKVFDKENIDVKVTCDGKEAEIREIEDYPLLKCFGLTILKRYGGHLSIPIDLNRKEQHIEFSFSHNGEDYALQVQGTRSASKVGKDGSYWKICKGHIVYPKGSILIIQSVSLLDLLMRERRFYREHKKDNKNNKKIRTKFFHRWSMILAKKFCRKRIWITFDKLYKAGDNGEYIYHYIHDNVRGVKIYYVMFQDSADYKRLKQEKANILIHNSWKCHVMLAIAEVVLATHPSVWEYCGFPKEDIPIYKDLLEARPVCIQHGLTTMNIAQYQCRIYDDTRLYCCATNCEAENIKRPIFGYNNSNIRMTGLARFDGLRNAAQKQILITPTWRRNIVNAGIAFNQKKYNENFRSTEYFRLYNSLINDTRLIECAKTNGYRIIFLLHPAMSSQINDFDRNDYVELMQATGSMNYEKILTESTLMVTDYSSVQFDFAYMRKPIIYYHPETLPPQYEQGMFDYETMGFGPIIQRHEALIDSICYYIEGGCTVEGEYNERIDDFFAFKDFNNCERIFEETNNWLKKPLCQKQSEKGE